MQFGIRQFSHHLDDPEVWKLSRIWINNCMSNHVRCRPKANVPNSVFAQNSMNPEVGVIPRNIARSFPTRLIDLGNVEDATIRPRLVIRDIDFNDDWKVAAYMTLSHCWGKCHMVELCSHNIELFRNSIKFQDLPKTFSDAMITAKSLGVRFLWIDSLCIIQDSSEDWSRESLLMADIYSNSACNICAVDAEDDSVGFLCDRDPNSVEPFVFRGRLKGKTVPFLVDNTEDISSHPRNVLSSRAWVFQEQLLSPRCLMFSRKEVSWQCRELEASETHPLGTNVSPHLNNYPEDSKMQCVLSGIVDDRLLFGSLPLQPANYLSWKDPRVEIWAEILTRYTSRNITVPSDKLIAIAAIAQSLSPYFGCYYAGLWSNPLPVSLLWHVERDEHNPPSSLHPPQWRTPSWSWASLNGQISHIFDRVFYEYDTMLVRIQEVTTNPSGGEFGHITDAQLVLSGHLGTATWGRGLFIDANAPEDWNPPKSID
jgi:hypothetical protein